MLIGNMTSYMRIEIVCEPNKRWHFRRVAMAKPSYDPDRLKWMLLKWRKYISIIDISIYIWIVFRIFLVINMLDLYPSSEPYLRFYLLIDKRHLNEEKCSRLTRWYIAICNRCDWEYLYSTTYYYLSPIRKWYFTSLRINNNTSISRFNLIWTIGSFTQPFDKSEHSHTYTPPYTTKHSALQCLT